MNVVVGVDPAATGLAAVVTFGGAYRIETRTMPEDNVQRCSKAEQWMYRIVREHAALHDVYVFIEDPVVGRGGAYATIAVARVQGALIAGATRGGAAFIETVNNMTWKKKVIGGKVGKPEIARHVKRTWPRVYVEAKGSQDVYDAACINRYGEMVLNMKIRVAKRKAAKAAGRGGLVKK